MRRFLYILLVLSVIPMLFSVPPPLKLICGLFQAFYLPGIVFLIYIGTGLRSPLDKLCIAPVLSPLVLTVLILLMHAVTGSLDLSIPISLALLYLLLAVSPFLARRNGTANAHVPTGVVWIGSALCAFFVISYLINDYLFAYDMVRHSAIANEILYRGIPPLEPFFADIPIRSNWIAYVFMAVLKSISGLTMIHGMWVFSCFSIFTFPYLIARITRHVTRRRIHIFAIPLFALVGLSMAGWITWPLNIARALVGEVHGMAEIGRMIGQVELGGRSVVQFLTSVGAFPVNNLEKYLIIDVQHYALNLFLLFTIIVLSTDFQRKSHWRAALTAFFTMIGAFLFHIFTGIFLIIAAIVSGVVIQVLRRLKRGCGTTAFHSVTVPCCAVAAAAIALPFFASFRGVYADGIFVPDAIAFNVRNLLTIAIPLIVLLPFTWRGLRDTFRSDVREHMIIGTWIISFCIVGVVSDLRGILESMAVFPLMLLASIPVAKRILEAIGESRGVRRVLLSLWITVLFLVPAILTARGVILDKPKQAHHIRRYLITEHERSVYEWIRDNTEIDGVIVERNEYNVMPYYAFRRNFYMTSWEIENYGYTGEKVERYRMIRDELYSGGPIGGNTIEQLEAFDFDIYLVVWREDIELDPALETRFDEYPEWFAAVFENPHGKIYRLRRQ